MAAKIKAFFPGMFTTSRDRNGWIFSSIIYPNVTLYCNMPSSRYPHDQPSIGIILCKTRSQTVAEYALRDTNKPIGISEYRTTADLPNAVKGSLPTIEALEAELRKPDPPARDKPV
jgi:hypothetical protein